MTESDIGGQGRAVDPACRRPHVAAGTGRL